MKNEREVLNLIEAFEKTAFTTIGSDKIDSFKRYLDATIEQVRKQERDKVRSFLSELN